LSVVVGQALMLEEENTDPGAARRIGKISASAARCAKIVKTFLAMARQKPLSPQPAPLNEIVATAIDVATMGQQTQHLTIETTLAENLPLVQIDQDQIAQVFINLILNAAQAMKDQTNARLVISTRFDPAQDQVIARFADNGPGIPPDLRKRVFEPFFTTKDIGEGTGVGLALSRQVISTHGGRLDILDGDGAVFELSVPCAEAVPAPPEAPPATKPARARVLLVEDEAEVAETLSDILRDTGVEVVWAANAQAGLDALDQGGFDAVLSDLRMPGMNGRQMLDLIRARYPDMVRRVAFVTGDSMSADAEAIRAAAGSVLLEKPVAPREVRALLDSLLSEDTP
jgi:CheY-like chemotaxis protein/anti-sigma regulatory factor (Ser/Thr protein kinase)